MRLRQELLLVTWDPGDGTGQGVFRVTDTEDRLLMVLGTDGPVHSAVVFLALAAMKHWQAPAQKPGYTAYPPERQPTGAVIYAVLANDFPIAIGLGPTEAVAFADLGADAGAPPGEGAVEAPTGHLATGLASVQRSLFRRCRRNPEPRGARA
jgi:hypothetical protein